MTNTVLNHLAHTSLLPSEMSAAINSGTPPPLEELLDTLLIAALDCEAMTASDPTSTWTEKRTARQALIVAFLSALVMAHEHQ